MMYYTHEKKWNPISVFSSCAKIELNHLFGNLMNEERVVCTLLCIFAFILQLSFCVCASLCLFVRVSLVGSHFISIFHSYSLQLLLIFNWLKMLFGFHFFLRISIAWEFLNTFHLHAYKNTHFKVYFKSLKFKIPIALHLNQTE